MQITALQQVESGRCIPVPATLLKNKLPRNEGISFNQASLLLSRGSPQQKQFHCYCTESQNRTSILRGWSIHILLPQDVFTRMREISLKGLLLLPVGICAAVDTAKWGKLTADNRAKAKGTWPCLEGQAWVGRTIKWYHWVQVYRVNGPQDTTSFW